MHLQCTWRRPRWRIGSLSSDALWAQARVADPPSGLSMDTLFEHIALASIEEARRPLLPLHAAQATLPPPEPETPLEPVPYADEGDAEDGLVYFSSRLVRLPAHPGECASH
jgi:hypothetical protein